MEDRQAQHSEYRISTDASEVDVDVVHHFLSTQSGWATGISRELVEESLRHSLCFSVFQQDRMVGFCRLVTDMTTFGYLVDVFVVPDMRGKGISRLLMDAVMAHPAVKKFRRFTLATSTAHGLYEKFGFTPLSKPESFMEVYRPKIYLEG
ncbi:GNAT family N-acetyltransferase [Undibacterium sp. Ji50W]|uniref:GNAT family N-acetyltransferase n=1 Tax=Undibacterium sp. Ji50W TaxID=3413041 RepID=UPI003BF15AA9